MDPMGARGYAASAKLDSDVLKGFVAKMPVFPVRIVSKRNIVEVITSASRRRDRESFVCSMLSVSLLPAHLLHSTRWDSAIRRVQIILILDTSYASHSPYSPFHGESDSCFFMTTEAHSP